MYHMRIIFLGLVLLAIGLSACGRRGPLESQPGPPPSDDFILDKTIK